VIHLERRGITPNQAKAEGFVSCADQREIHRESNPLGLHVRKSCLTSNPAKCSAATLRWVRAF
jgi:hypothetical protein